MGRSRRWRAAARPRPTLGPTSLRSGWPNGGAYPVRNSARIRSGTGSSRTWSYSVWRSSSPSVLPSRKSRSCSPTVSVSSTAGTPQHRIAGEGNPFSTCMVCTRVTIDSSPLVFNDVPCPFSVTRVTDRNNRPFRAPAHMRHAKTRGTERKCRRAHARNASPSGSTFIRR